MKRILLYLAVVAVGALGFASCSSTEKEFNEQFLIGYWKAGTDNMHFKSDHTGTWWDTADTPSEEYGTKMNWTLSGENLSLELCFQEVGGCDVPKSYTVLDLTETRFSFKDYTGKTRTFSKAD